MILSALDYWLIVAAILIVGICALLLRKSSLRTKKFIAELREGIERFSSGDLEFRLKPDYKYSAYAEVSLRLNKLAGKFGRRLRGVEEQRNELESVLENLRPGVIIIDRNQVVLRINKSAAALLGIEKERAIGRSVQEVMRNINLQQFVEKALHEKEPIESEILLYSDQERSIQAYSSPVNASGGERSGALVILNDITQLKKLESVRRDFVANVSHELKTPITSIKGFVETLLDGALSDSQESKRFLGIILRQSERLNKIVENLLDLARMEHAATREDLKKSVTSINQIIKTAIQNCEMKARAKQIILLTECLEDINVEVNESLLEQALINLIDNGIKYSNPGSEVKVKVTGDDSTLRIDVIDSGIGIEPLHLSRVFERFYRVDPARSRQQGGTGLGLSIVKHIALLHGGSATAESRVGSGSTFSLSVPIGTKAVRKVA